MRYIEHEVDLCVVGGGIAGLCAAVSAARNGIRVALMQDRPVLGGNASSEIRMWICGAHGEFNRESGIVEELCLENYYRNGSLSFSIWDSVLYEKARFEKNITLLLNCTCMKAENDGDEIVSVTGWQMTTETYHTVKAKYFADCSGDSILAPLTGAEYRIGREAKSEFGETIPPDTADSKTMGMSVLLQARETDRKQEFVPPDWAYVYENDDALFERDHRLSNNFWWIELGGDKDSIHDTEEMRDELLKIAFGVWDHIKNHGDHGADNWQLDWVGFLPGKRESRRYLGEVIVTEKDVDKGGISENAVAYAGWTMDDHFPEGFYYGGGHPTIYHPAPSPWLIPFGAMVSRSKENLLFAGRNISVTHAALSSTRVMATCGVLGQALGTAAAIAVKDKTPIRKIDMEKLRQTLMYDDGYIPTVMRKINAKTASSGYPDEILRNGHDRRDKSGSNIYTAKKGSRLEFAFQAPTDIEEMRIVFDSNLDRGTKNMPCNFPLEQKDFKMPQTLVKEYKVLAYTKDGEKEICHETKNRRRLVKIAFPKDLVCEKVILVPIETWGSEGAGIFSVDFR